MNLLRYSCDVLFVTRSFCVYECYIECFFCTLCRSFYSKKSKVTPLTIPAESEDELQNENDSDDEEYIQSETEEEIIESETEEEIIESDTGNEQVNGNQILPRAQDNAEEKWGERMERSE